MVDDIRELIAGVASAAGEGAGALRRAGIEVGLEDFRVEVHVEPGDTVPEVAVTVVLARPTTG